MAKVSSRRQQPKEPQQQQQHHHPKQHDDNFVAKSPPDIRDFTNSRSRMVAQRVVDSSFEGGEEDDLAENRLPVIAASEGPIIVTFGGVQLLAGILMAAFGVLTMLHEASLASVGAGLWGGAMAAANGLVGMIAGFRGCYQKSDHVSLLAVTVYLALCLVAIGVANLALVLTATGLLRDSQRPMMYSLPSKSVDDEITSVNSIISSMDLGEQLRPNWAPILTNLGLLLITSVECLITIAAAFRCYCYVSRCRNKVHRQPSRSNRINHGYRGRIGGIKVPSPDIASTSYCSTSSSKQKLVRQWLGQQQSYTRTQVPFYPSPPPNCCLPPPYYTVDRSSRKTRYPSGSYVSYYSTDYNNYMMPYHGAGAAAARTRPTAAADASARSRDRHSSHQPKESRPDYEDRKEASSVDDRKSKKRSFTGNDRIRRISVDSNYTVDDIDKTYTGMDREIAEEFISVTMEPKRNLN